MILYFSATGNTKWVAQQLSTFLSDSYIYSITNVETDVFESLAPEEPLGFCFPIHAWGMPEPVKRVVADLPKHCHTRYLYMVCTCGDDCGTTHLQFASLLKKQGHTPQFMASVQMPNTYVNLPGFDVDAAELETHKKEQAKEWVRDIAERIQSREQGCFVTEGKFPSLKSGLLRKGFLRFLVNDKFFRVTDDCIGCSQCVQHCPMGNMLMEADHPIWLHNGSCLTCMACYHLCPVHAIRFGRFTDRKGQYYFK